MHVKVLMSIDVVQWETGCTKALKLRLYLRLRLPLDLGREEKRNAKTDGVTRKSPIESNEIWNLAPRKNRAPVDQGEMQSNAEQGQAACPLNCVLHRRCANHQA